MRQAAESQASIWQETGKKMRRDLERLLTQEEQSRRDVERIRHTTNVELLRWI